MFNGELESMELKETNIEELSDIFRIFNNFEVIKFTNFRVQTSISDCENYLKRFLEFNKGEPFQFGPYSIYLDTQFIGLCGIQQKDREDGISELWYLLDKPYWGQGYGTEVVKKLFEIGKKNTALKELYAEAVADNPASWKILDNLRMTRVQKIENGFKKKERAYTLYCYSFKIPLP